MDLSVIVPVLNEEENAPELHRRITEALASTGKSFEVLFVDDGSTDGTVARLRELQAGDPRLVVVKLRKNYGQTAAMRAGIDEASGRVLVTMDGDLQNDPLDIPTLVERVEAGYDLVAGWRKDRKDALIRRKVPSRVANWLIAKVTGVPIHDNGCSLKAYDARTIKATPLYSEMHRFIPAMVSVAGGRIAEVAVRHHKRRHGTSKYGLSRIGKVFLDIIKIKMLVAFWQRPLHWFGWLAVPMFVGAAALLGTHLVGLFSTEDAAPGMVWPSLAVLAAYLGAHFVFLGLLGELIVRTARPYEYRSLSRSGTP